MIDRSRTVTHYAGYALVARSAVLRAELTPVQAELIVGR